MKLNIENIKKESRAKYFASVVGKSTVNKESEEYKATEQLTKFLLKEGFGVVHGGYAGGIMQAVSDTANNFINENNLSKNLNIGVPQEQHDGLWDRVKNARFTNVAKNIFERLEAVTSADIVVVSPLGGDGTDLEQNVIFHENIVKTGMNKYGNEKYNEKLTPLIFFQTKNGTDWKSLITTKMQILDTSSKSLENHKDWLYFVSSIEDFEILIKNLKNNL
ncbi:MAG: hypothetical protein U0469_02585 [Candidatus Paceibacterota bacterium]